MNFRSWRNDFHRWSKVPCNSSSQFVLLIQSSWNKIFISIVRGVKNPMGSKILAVTLRTDRLVRGSACANGHRSEKLKKISSVRVFQFIPRILTTASSLSEVVESQPTLDFANDSSSSLLTLVTSCCVFADPGELSSFVICICSFREFDRHFLRLNPPLDITFLHLL